MTAIVIGNNDRDLHGNSFFINFYDILSEILGKVKHL